MPAADYAVGGVYWERVQDVMKSCGCSRLRAVSALKSCDNDSVAAIASFKEVDLDTVIDNLAKMTIEHTATSVTSDRILARPAPATQFFPALTALPKPYQPPDDNKSGAELGINQTSSLMRSVPDSGTSTNAPVQFGMDTKMRASPADPQGHEAPPPYRETAPPKPTPPAIPPIEPLPSALQWDFQLPYVRLDESEEEFAIEEGRSKPFSARRLISVLQHGMPVTRLQHYLSFFSATTLRERINEYVCGYPAIFYIAATNDPGLVRIWAGSGGDINLTEPFRRIPLLAFAILMSGASGADSTGVVIELLSLGADASRVPRPFFSPYIDDPVDKLPFSAGMSPSQDARTSWCVEWMQPILAERVNLTQRYFLEKASKDQGTTDRQLQVAQLHGATALLGISAFLIGQTSAARMVTQKLLAHMALLRSKPLVMVFAGPSGHGKTELARRMGQLLSLEIECVDCTEMKHETDLFGAKKPYIGYDVGSPLNNFLARLSGKRSIVFLDEFEKTTPEVKNALLIPFDEGRHTDRRSRSVIDCTQTIWIIATNAVDNIVLDYCDAHKDIFNDDDPIRQMQLVNDASTRMKKQLKTEFGNPLTGRITSVIPFLPFSPSEAAVVAHKYILELKAKVRQSIRSSGRQLVGNIILEIRRDGAICNALAAEGYDSDHGARSLKAIVDSKIQDELVKAYLEEEGPIQDRQPLVRYVVDFTRGRALSVFKVVE